ncbi:related to Iron transport protein 1 [Serendipita indica DSM 11827]|uniref:Related to Iron transport protein 1 n=1 Tax=Serendipita indica (strain DSM 11827) TaxID=1109443 RepID=G4TNP2_SERID|nr:related to Iron transport protein 1 [Serendipita indica DSM 11827]
MSIQSALIGRLLGLLFERPFTPEENVVLQTTAVATGTMPLAAGFVGIIPALGLLEVEKDGSGPVSFTWGTAIAWSFGIAFFGVFLAVPLRKQTIIKEKLPFPSGTATAQLISVLYQHPLRKEAAPKQEARPTTEPAEEAQWLLHEEVDASLQPEQGIAAEVEARDEDSSVSVQQGWSPLVWSFAAACFITILSYFFPVVFAMPIFGLYLAREWLWYFTPSLSYVGQGIIMGFPTTVSMNLGMFVGWAILSPLAKHNGWAPGKVGDMSNGGRGWILWISLAIMTADSLVSLTPVFGEIVSHLLKSFKYDAPILGIAGVKSDEEVEPPARLIPRRWVIWGLVISVTGGTLIVWLVFGYEGIKPWATLLGFALGGAMSLLGVRALGETDLNPVSGLGKISQLFFAVLQPGNVVANIIAGGVAEAGAQQAGDLMQDFKTGHLVGASPRAQFQGQLIGSLVSIFVTTTAFILYSNAYEIPGPNFPAPTAYVWLNLARLLRSSSLPPHAGVFMAVLGGAAALSSGIKAWASHGRKPRWVKWIPSGVAFAIGMLNTPNFAIARLLGGCVELWWRRKYMRKIKAARDGEDEENEDGLGELAIVIIASGFVLGEGIGSIVNLTLRIMGFRELSCWGCAKGLCGGCP